jgi:glycerol-3-phosphate dehydrogenase
VANQFFPNAKLSERDVISTWAGLRPLIADPNGRPSDISRSHEIRSPEPGWWDVAGGKLTTYRLMAEHTVDQIVKSLNRTNGTNRSVARCRTAEEPLLPADQVRGVSGILPPAFSRSVVEHSCANEWAVHLDDVMVRRTSWHYYFKDAAQKAERVADWMSELLGWSDDVRASERQRYHASVNGQPAPSRSSSPASQQPNDQPVHPVV